MADSPRPRRSVLFLPASNPRAIAKARTLPADVIVLDLEDAVAPDAKDAARDAAMAAVAEGFGERELAVRVNGLDTPWGAQDLAACRDAGVGVVLVPKVGEPEDIDRYAAGVGQGAVLWAMVETCLAVGNLWFIADRARRMPLQALVVGANDLALEMRARPGPDRAELAPVLAAAVCAARAHGLSVIDAVCNDYRNLARVAAECAQGRRFGFDGKSVIHPAQIAAANAAFGPDTDEIARARAVVEAFSQPEARGRGAVSLDGEMVERLHLVAAERTLAMAEAIAGVAS